MAVHVREEKKWGKHTFWGVGYDYDPMWYFTEEQRALQKSLIELCRTKIRPQAPVCDRQYQFPRSSLNALAELGLLGLIIPKELGGMGENHVCAAMVVETIARYGCPSTAMVYVMHLGACSILLFRYHDNPLIQDLLRRMNKEKLVGTLSYSDPATGGHFWFPLSSKCRKLDDDHVQLLKFGSWATSAGFADWYTIQTVSPGFSGDYGNLSCFLFFQDEVRANTDEWLALGMHGNQSGPLICEGVLSEERRIGPYGDGSRSNDECVDPYFLLLTAACWNGISLACMDVAKKHVTRKAHADVGMRICDYPSIQDYFGDSMCKTNGSRGMLFSVAQGMDMASKNNSWDIHKDLTVMPRATFLHWLWQVKYVASKIVSKVGDVMLQTCGGTGYKEELGLERLFRDGKAGWLMAPSNEVLRQFVGKTVLLGFQAIDYWSKKVNEHVVHHELQKMTIEEKEALAKKLLQDVHNSKPENAAKLNPNQDKDFDNPFNTKAPEYIGEMVTAIDNKKHGPGLKPDKYTQLRLVTKTDISQKMSSFRFALPNSSDHLGCLPGQYIKVRIYPTGKPAQERFFSPVSKPSDYGHVEIVLRYETKGLLSEHFKMLKPGDLVEFRGPCGGLEYKPNTLSHLSLIASGGGITPGLQLIRCIMSNPADTTQISLLYWSENYDEILYREELDKYSGDKRMKLIHTLGEVGEDWDGEEGFVDIDMIKRHMVKPGTPKHKIVLCGGTTMVISCLYSLQQLGYPPEDIFVYGQFGVEQVRMAFGRSVKLSGHICGLDN